MTSDDDDSREQGIEFGDLADELEGASFPISHEALLDKYGDHELTLVDDQVTLREALGPEQEREYEDAESVRQAVFTMVGGDAVGRQGYSDRGGTASDTDDTTEKDSV